MTEPRPDRPDLESLVAECLARLDDEGDAALDALCAAHPERAGELRTRIERLRGAGLVAPRARPTPTAIGPYRILRELGSGGMGQVYLAEQREPIKRRVAIKCIRSDLATGQFVARFDAERQALALLDHPGIAQVFETGTTDDGRPYFVMEYVDGVPITEYCDARQATVAERLDLFVQLCDAVQHAHQTGLIHRDLKPGNVLVRERDGVPVVKVIDFGLAKAIHRPLVDRTLFTEAGQLLGTPEYMSPEQAATDGAQVDTRTDVYALGVILYELLTGVLPFDPVQLRRAGWLEMVRVIREVEPPAPSTRLSSLGAGAEEIARSRRTRLATLRSAVRGELDWITHRATEKDRNRRYASVSELAADLRRHLAGEPVLARPPSTAYRLKKLVRRHRLAVGVAVAFLLTIVAALVVTTNLFLASRENLRRFDRLAERDVVDGLVADARDVLWPDAPDGPSWPTAPDRVARFDGWLAEARSQAAAAPRTASEIATLRALAQPGPGERVLLDNLERLLEAQQGLGGADGLVAEVEDRLAWLTAMRELTVDQRAADWAAAADRVRASERYGFALAPQPGLVPLGPDPRSGLEEFALLHPGSALGEPRREPGATIAHAVDQAPVLVLIPADRYRFGAQTDDPDGPLYDPDATVRSEGPVFEFEIEPYLIGKFEIDQSQFAAVTGRTPSYFQKPVLPERPVESVTWHDAMDFCRRIGATLPTELQWEAAARGGAVTRYATGFEPESLEGFANVADAGARRALNEVCVFATFDDGQVATAPCGSYAANAFGLHDVHGNVWEWCLDLYVREYGRVDRRSGDGYVGGFAEHRCPSRGGSFMGDPLRQRLTFRLAESARSSKLAIGFRIARPLIRAP
ncbi:MAG: SUMF1/EgtB/PvdO family nonheme iron enzyme [Planctomycetes bacterium]|nr:SUMF1/EgtB/PvdO family nonheme iron enzyme [Planctomycetota bacterium]